MNSNMKSKGNIKPICNSLNYLITYYTATWVNSNQAPVLMADGIEIDPFSIPGYVDNGMLGIDQSGKVAAKQGSIYLSELPRIVIKGEEKFLRQAIHTGEHLKYRGILYNVPQSINVNFLEKVVSTNGNPCVVLPIGLILERTI